MGNTILLAIAARAGTVISLRPLLRSLRLVDELVESSSRSEAAKSLAEI
jgi:hypothetical protein